MASNLRRSKRSFGQRFLRAEEQIDSASKKPSPKRIGSRIVTSSNLAPGAITTVTLAPEVSTAIVYAQATADGKNTIYYQNSEPTGGTYAEDDIWFDTDDDNRLYRHDGTNWVGFQLGDNAIAELSANKITAGTIDASVITVSNLDAGNLTSGTISAVNIGAVDITGATITGGSLDIGSGTFEVDSSGNLTATSATLTGAITGATTITIGSGDDVFKVDSAGNMWLGDAVYADAEFKVSNAGALAATSATITGTINATAGYIGNSSYGFNISNHTNYSKLSSNDNTGSETSRGKIDIRSYGDVYVYSTPTTGGHASQTYRTEIVGEWIKILREDSTNQPYLELGNFGGETDTMGLRFSKTGGAFRMQLEMLNNYGILRLYDASAVEKIRLSGQVGDAEFHGTLKSANVNGGYNNTSTNSNGDVTISHGLNGTPDFVVVTPAQHASSFPDWNAQYVVINRTSTTFTVRVYEGLNDTVASGTQACFWYAGRAVHQ